MNYQMATRNDALTQEGRALCIALCFLIHQISVGAVEVLE